MALIFENLGKLERALDYWKILKSDEGCQKTVSILKKITNKQLIFDFLEWVLQKNPKVGLSLFFERRRKREGQSSAKDSSKNSQGDRS